MFSTVPKCKKIILNLLLKEPNKKYQPRVTECIYFDDMTQNSQNNKHPKMFTTSVEQLFRQLVKTSGHLNNYLNSYDFSVTS